MQNLFQKMDAYDINQKLCNETTLTNGFLVRCYLEIDSFNVSTYLTLFNACVFIPSDALSIVVVWVWCWQW